MAVSSPKKKTLIAFILFAMFLIGLSLGSLFLDQSQDIRQQAFVGSSDVGDYCPGGECIDVVTAQLQSGEYVSQTGVYSVTYNPATWEIAAIPPQATATDQEQSFFVSRTRWGFATVYLNATPLSPAQQAMSSLEFADELEVQIQNTLAANVTYTGKEVILVGEKEALRFDFTETILGREAVYHEYVLWGDTNYVEAETRSSGTPGMDTVVGDLLIQIKIDADAQVKGVSVERELSELELAELVKPSVANVLHLYCKQISVSADLPNQYMQNSYPFCNGGYGSGFIVGEDGLVATNGHVVTTYPEEDFVTGFSLGHPVFVDFAVDFVREVAFAQGLPTTLEEGRILASNIFQDPAGQQAILGGIFELYFQGYYSIAPLAEHHYVNLGTEPFEFASDEITPQNVGNFVIEKTAIFPAKVVGVDFANMFAKEVIIDGRQPDGSDVAILQLDGAEGYQYPSLKIGDADNLKDGENILIFGFPGAVSGQETGGPALVDYASSSTKVTVTKGIVSSIKKDPGGRTLIQTDASIGHGNSGGPAFNQRGEVIGIATYGISEEVGTFNFLRDVGDLVDLGENEGAVINTEPGETYLNWQTALDYFWQDRFTRSLDYLSLISQTYPIHPTVNGVIEDAETGIEEGRDIDLLFGVKKEFVYFGIGGLVLIIAGAGVMLFMKKRNKTVPPSAPPTSPPEPPASPPAEPQEQPLPEQLPEAAPVAAAETPLVTPPAAPVSQDVPNFQPAQPAAAQESFPQASPGIIS